MRGYKVFYSDWTESVYNNAVYQVDKTYLVNEKNKVGFDLTKDGFAFFTTLKDCFRWRRLNETDHLVEIDAFGNIYKEENFSIYYTNKIKILRELSLEEALEYINIGKNNFGKDNSGDTNLGDNNTGNGNKGDRNAGNWNIGSWNNGYYNIGDMNGGYNNIGDYNSGDGNIGNYNSGIYNVGHFNSGDWNSTKYSSGCFNTEEPTLTFFNKPSDITASEWRKSKAYHILQTMPLPTVWTGDENNSLLLPSREGYVKKQSPIELAEARQKWWEEDLNDIDRDLIFGLPNFRGDIFKEITSINVERKGEN